MMLASFSRNFEHLSGPNSELKQDLCRKSKNCHPDGLTICLVLKEDDALLDEKLGKPALAWHRQLIFLTSRLFDMKAANCPRWSSGHE